MGSPVSKAGDTQADATLTKLQCQGRCERWYAAPGPQHLATVWRCLTQPMAKKKRTQQLFTVSGGGWGLHPAASGNNVRLHVTTYGMPDFSARSAPNSTILRNTLQ